MHLAFQESKFRTPVLSLLMVLVLQPSPVFSEQRNLLSEARPSVATIITRKFSTNPHGAPVFLKSENGCGFLLSDSKKQVFLFTALHVVANNQNETTEIAVYLSSEKAPLRAIIVRADPAKDFAILKLATPPVSTNVLKLGNDPIAGQNVHLVGRLVFDDPTRKIVQINEKNDKESDAFVVQSVGQEIGNTRTVFTSKTPFPVKGKSGSPFLDENGEVVGVLTNQLSGVGLKTAVGVSVGEIQAFVKDFVLGDNNPPGVFPMPAMRNGNPSLEPASERSNQAPQIQQKIVEHTFTANVNGLRITGCNWAQTSMQPAGNMYLKLNEIVLAKLNGKLRIPRQNGDRFLENSNIGFSVLLPERFCFSREIVDFGRGTYSFEASDQKDNQQNLRGHKVRLLASHVAPNQFQNALLNWNGQNLQPILAESRRCSLKLFLQNDDLGICPNEVPVVFGGVDRVLNLDWQFQQRQGSNVAYRYRSYQSTNLPAQQEFVVLYVYHAQDGVMFTAAFNHPGSASLAGTPAQELIDKWAFLLSLMVF